jgi:transcription antitermination factor NusG
MAMAKVAKVKPIKVGDKVRVYGSRYNQFSGIVIEITRNEYGVESFVLEGANRPFAFRELQLVK